MLLRILVLIALVPILEGMVLYRLWHEMGFLNLLGLLIIAGIVGAALARRAGVRAIAQVQADLAAGRVPADSLLDGLVVLISAVLLVIPGLLSDVAAIVLLLPPVRARVRAAMKKRFSGRMIVFDGRGPVPPGDDFVDVEVKSARDINEPPRLME